MGNSGFKSSMPGEGTAESETSFMTLLTPNSCSRRCRGGGGTLLLGDQAHLALASPTNDAEANLTTLVSTALTVATYRTAWSDGLCSLVLVKGGRGFVGYAAQPTDDGVGARSLVVPNRWQR